jgi:hypothetical protein
VLLHVNIESAYLPSGQLPAHRERVSASAGSLVIAAPWHFLNVPGTQSFGIRLDLSIAQWNERTLHAEPSITLAIRPVEDPQPKVNGDAWHDKNQERDQCEGPSWHVTPFLDRAQG